MDKLRDQHRGLADGRINEVVSVHAVEASQRARSGKVTQACIPLGCDGLSCRMRPGVTGIEECSFVHLYGRGCEDLPFAGVAVKVPAVAHSLRWARNPKERVSGADA